MTGQPPGWVVKSVRSREADVTDTPVEFKTSTDPAALEVTMSRQGAIVSGRVLDGAGKSIDAGYVLLFSANPARRQFGHSSVKTTRPKADGSFTLGSVRAGEYLIVAVTPESLMYLQVPDAAGLERAAQAGERIVLVESEKRGSTSRVTKPAVNQVSGPNRPCGFPRVLVTAIGALRCL